MPHHGVCCAHTHEHRFANQTNNANGKVHNRKCNTRRHTHIPVEWIKLFIIGIILFRCGLRWFRTSSVCYHTEMMAETHKCQTNRECGICEESLIIVENKKKHMYRFNVTFNNVRALKSFTKNWTNCYEMHKSRGRTMSATGEINRNLIQMGPQRRDANGDSARFITISQTHAAHR